MVKPDFYATSIKDLFVHSFYLRILSISFYLSYINTVYLFILSFNLLWGFSYQKVRVVYDQTSVYPEWKSTRSHLKSYISRVVCVLAHVCWSRFSFLRICFGPGLTRSQTVDRSLVLISCLSHQLGWFEQMDLFI